VREIWLSIPVLIHGVWGLGIAASW
jgi:hypothetical protein